MVVINVFSIRNVIPHEILLLSVLWPHRSHYSQAIITTTSTTTHFQRKTINLTPLQEFPSPTQNKRGFYRLMLLLCHTFPQHVKIFYSHTDIWWWYMLIAFPPAAGAVPPGRVTPNYATCRVALQCASRETCCFSRFAPPNRINSTRLRLRERVFSITVFLSPRIYAADVFSNFTGQLFMTFVFASMFDGLISSRLGAFNRKQANFICPELEN